jgi:hypothetical protein
MSDNRVKRDDPPRTRSNRTTTSAAPPTSAHRRVIEKAVKLAYGVVDDHIAQGQKAAESLRAGTYTSADFDTDLKMLLERALSLSKEIGALGVDTLDAVRKMAGPRLGAPPVSDVAVEVKSKRRNQVKYDLRSSPTRFSPAVPPLYSADRTKEPLKDIRFEVRDGQHPVLIVNIPDNHPYGVYSGAIVDSETHEPAGFISVRVLEETQP